VWFDVNHKGEIDAMSYNINLWTVTDLKIAREMAEKGHTAKEIGNAIGRSKSSVIGYFNRQGLQLSKKRGYAAPANPKPERKAKKGEKLPPDFSLLTPPKKESDLPPTKTFMQLTYRDCRAITGQPQGIYTEYCGREVRKNGCSWCEDHFKMYYGYKRETNEHKQTHTRNDFLFAK
jgi:hypothetical protein